MQVAVNNKRLILQSTDGKQCPVFPLFQDPQAYLVHSTHEEATCISSMPHSHHCIYGAEIRQSHGIKPALGQVGLSWQNQETFNINPNFIQSISI